MPKLWFLNPLNIFWIGFILHVVGYGVKINLVPNTKLSDYVQMLGLLLIFWGAGKTLNYDIKSPYLKIIYLLYLLWTLIVIFRGLTYTLNFFRTSLLNNDFGVLIYLSPLIMLFPLTQEFFKKLFIVILTFGAISLVFEIILFRSLLTRSKETQDIIEFISPYFSITCGFILMTYKYHSWKRKIFALIITVVSLIFALYQARRGLSVIILSVLLSGYLLYVLNTKKKILIIYLSVLFAVSGLLYISSIYQIQNNKLFNHLAERGDEDTRTGVELYFYNDMKINDWILGRGMSGVYYCPGIGDDKVDYRYLIETGYLQIILKGGLFRLFLYLLIAIPAVFMGLFNSQNLLGKASALWILISIGSLYPSTVESFGIAYLLTWICIGVCYSKEIRNLKDDKIKTHLFHES